MNFIKAPKSWKNLDTHYREVLVSDWYKIISKPQNKFVYYTHEFYKQKGYEFQMLPITTGGVSSPMGAGSDSTPVKIAINGVETYLADSMQFFLGFACRLNNTGNYYIAPSFRGELADERHLCQFYHAEAEIPGSLEEILSLVEEYLRFLVSQYHENNIQDISKITGNTDHLSQMLNTLKIGVPRCTFSEATILLQSKSDCFKYKDGIQMITSIGEQELIKHFGGTVWLLYPEHMSVPFYQAYHKTDHACAECADLLFGIGETVGAGERHYSKDEVMTSLSLHSVNENDYDWYVDMKSLVPLQTSGFGMGIERFLLWLLKHDDIRDMQLLPRFNGVESKF